MTGFTFAAILALVMQSTGSPTSTKHLTITPSVSPSAAAPSAAAPGTRVSLVLDVTPKPAMHVYAPGQKDYIPISLALEVNAAVKAHVIRFPKPETLVLKDLGETQLVYSKPFRIVQDVTVARRRAAGAPLTITGALKYQACDATICYAPVTVPVAWTLDLKRPVKGTP